MSFIKHVTGKNVKEYKPLYPEKYVGEYPIIERSSYENAFNKWCDMNPSILQWASEPIAIPYYHPLKKRTARYFPDYMIKVKDKNNKETLYIVEIKPDKEVKRPNNSNKKKESTKIYESATFIINNAKWKAAELYCKTHGFTFRILTEKELFK